MRTLITLLLSLCFASVFGASTTFSRLAAVNKCWHEQKDVPDGLLPAYTPHNEQGWIQLHLSLVESVLRNRSTAHLTAEQQANRAACLNHLHQYWQAGRFPINEDYTYQTPIFIDKHDNFCAVGYLVKASGHENVSRMIAANTNLAYVREMHYPQLNEWANTNGFTIDELAWIQPAYPPSANTAAIGGGVDGNVNELFADDGDGKLYVGGAFANANGSLLCNNIAYVTKVGTTFTWHSMGGGLAGTVNTIVKHDGKIFAGGAFSTSGAPSVTTVAYWDGTAWHSAGCMPGQVRKLIVYGGELYAAGDITVCGGPVAVNFAKWDGTNWTGIPGLTGRLNTMEVMSGSLVLAGDLTYVSYHVNAIKWTAAGGFQKFGNNLANEVHDLKVFEDTLYAACKRTDATDTFSLLMKLSADNWVKTTLHPYISGSFQPSGGGMALNTLCPQDHMLNIGGQFSFLPMLGDYAYNSFNITPSGADYSNWFCVDSAINKMAFFGGELIVGGRFKTGSNGYAWGIPLNGIARRTYPAIGVDNTPVQQSLTAYPNPVASGSLLTIQNATKATSYSMRDVSGKLIAEGPLHGTASEQILTPKTAPGSYILELVATEKKSSATYKVEIK